MGTAQTQHEHHHHQQKEPWVHARNSSTDLGIQGEDNKRATSPLSPCTKTHRELELGHSRQKKNIKKKYSRPFLCNPITINFLSDHKGRCPLPLLPRLPVDSSAPLPPPRPPPFALPPELPPSSLHHHHPPPPPPAPQSANNVAIPPTALSPPPPSPLVKKSQSTPSVLSTKNPLQSP